MGNLFVLFCIYLIIRGLCEHAASQSNHRYLGSESSRPDW